MVNVKLKPSAVEQFIATLPEDLQVKCLNAIKEEHDRWERGDLTPDEKELQEVARNLGRSAAQRRDEIALKILKGL